MPSRVDARSPLPLGPADADRSPDTPLGLSTWLGRHQLISVAYVAFITVVIGWSSATGHSGAELVGYMAPLFVSGAIATRAGLSERVREYAIIFGLTTAAALVANFAEGSILAPITYVLTICLASLYERRSTLVGAVVLSFTHQVVFGTVFPTGRPIPGIPEWVTTTLFGLSAVIVAALLTIPWATNTAHRRMLRQQRQLINDQLAVSEIVIVMDRDGVVTLISDHGLMLLALDRDDVIGQDFFELVVTPDELAAARSGHEQLLSAGAELAAPAFYEFEHAVTIGNGQRRTFLWRVTVSMEGDEVVGTVASGFDITEVRRAQRQLQREQRDLAQLQKLAQAVARESDARESVVQGIEQLVDASIAGLFEPAAGGGELILTRCSRPGLIGARVPLDGHPSGNAIAFTTGEPFFVADAENHPLIHQELREQTGSHSFLYHPVICDGQAAAVLVVGWQERVAELGSRQTNLVALAAEEAASALQRLAAMRRWEEAALTDVLTGVPNRRAFDHLFADALTHAAAEHQPLAIALMDLNGFKLLNDTEGHAAGDRVLKESASLWLQELRPTDVLARLGGDEFGVLLPNCGVADTDSVAGRLRRALRHGPGCGVGVTVWDGEESASELMHRADEALYADKAERAMARISQLDRLDAVHATGLVGRGADARLDELAETATALLGVPVSMISLLDEDRQHFVGKRGLDGLGVEGDSIPWSESFCRHPVATGRPLIINDVSQHPLVAGLPIPVADDVVVGAYAGIPIVDDNGHVLGTTCAIDVAPRDWTQDELATLRSVAARATQLILRGVRS